MVVVPGRPHAWIESVAVPVVNVRIVWMYVLQRFMLVCMGVGLTGRIARNMIMPMMVVVNMPVVMPQWFVYVSVFVALGEVKP